MTKRLACLATSLAALIALQGCSSRGPIGEDPSLAVADLASLPQPTNADYARPGYIEVVRPLDVLSVSVFGVEELSFEEIRVGQGGSFDFPLIGDVEANGRSLAEISFEMEQRLATSYVRNPDVRIDFASREAQLFTVGGEVEMPGQYPIIRPITLVEAVAIGRGGSDFARLREVVVFREIDGRRYIGVYDLTAIQRGNYPDPQIYPNDVIVVGASANQRLLTQLAPFIPLVTTPLILIEQATRN